VQQRRRDRRRQQPEVGEDLGDRDRVRDERLAAAPYLALVPLGGDLVRPDDGPQVGLRMGGAQRAQESVQLGGRGGA
jgi:hypothetical protein